MFRCEKKVQDLLSGVQVPEQENRNVTSLKNLSRELIGFVTSSHDGFKIDQCGGIALCSLNGFWNTIQDMPDDDDDDDVGKLMESAPFRRGYDPISIVLLRNTSSLHFSVAWMYIKSQ